MRVFVTGASGWIGSAVVPELVGAGHQVLGLARSDSSAAAIAATGAEVLRGDLHDLDALHAGTTSCDGVVHLAFIHDFTQFEAAVRADAQAIGALGAALEGSGRPLVIASGTPASPGRVTTERDEPEPTGFTAGRLANAQAALGMAARGVRSSVLGLPRSMHGDGDRHGFVPRLVDLARERGVSGYVGDGSSRWPAVHVLDAARLFRLAVEEAPAGSVLHAVGDEGVPVRDIAAAIGRHLDLPTHPSRPRTSASWERSSPSTSPPPAPSPAGSSGGSRSSRGSSRTSTAATTSAEPGPRRGWVEARAARAATGPATTGVVAVVAMPQTPTSVLVGHNRGSSPATGAGHRLTGRIATVVSASAPVPTPGSSQNDQLLPQPTGHMSDALDVAEVTTIGPARRVRPGAGRPRASRRRSPAGWCVTGSVPSEPPRCGPRR